MTLTSMAGIQLTDADNSNNASTALIQDMSGAMPTVTVEELNVPVFIDEYLQQSATAQANSSAITTATADKNTTHDKENDIGIDESDLKDLESYIIGEISYRSECVNSNSYDCISVDQLVPVNYNNSDDNNSINSMEDTDMNMDLATQFHMGCNNEIDNTLSFDTDFDISSFASDITMHGAEEAVDINQFSGVSMEDCLIHSQGQQPMLSENIYRSQPTSNNNSQTFYTDAEPVVPKNESDTMGFEFEMCPMQDVLPCFDTTKLESGIQDLYERSLGDTTTVIQTRPRLNILSATSATFSNAEINTPSIIDQISQIDSHQKPSDPAYLLRYLVCDDSTNHNSVHTYAVNGLQHSYDPNDDGGDVSNQSQSTNVTPFHFDGVTSSANSSPPDSPATITSNSNISKRKRGRPSKEHSDRPDPTKLRDLPETERRRLENRAKNNEASRQSRLKNKHKTEEIIREEQEEIRKNKQLKQRLHIMRRQDEALRNYLYKEKEKNSSQN